VTLAVRHGWPIRALICDADRPLSAWARSIQAGTAAPVHVAMVGDLLAELGEPRPGPARELKRFVYTQCRIGGGFIYGANPRDRGCSGLELILFPAQWLISGAGQSARGGAHRS
jgi:SpoU L30e-like domain